MQCAYTTYETSSVSKDFAECCLGIIKDGDITHLQEPRMETCSSKCEGGPVNVFTHRMLFYDRVVIKALSYIKPTPFP